MSVPACLGLELAHQPGPAAVAVLEHEVQQERREDEDRADGHRRARERGDVDGEQAPQPVDEAVERRRSRRPGRRSATRPLATSAIPSDTAATICRRYGTTETISRIRARAKTTRPTPQATAEAIARDRPRARRPAHRRRERRRDDEREQDGRRDRREDDRQGDEDEARGRRSRGRASRPRRAGRARPGRTGGGVRRAAQLSRRQRSRRPPITGRGGRQPSIAFFLSASYSGTVIAPESLSWLSFSIWSAVLTPAAAFWAASAWVIICTSWAVTLGRADDVDQRAEERDDEDHDDPDRLPAARQVVAAEDVREDRDEDPDQHEPEEEDDHRPDHVPERVGRAADVRARGDQQAEQRQRRQRGPDQQLAKILESHSGSSPSVCRHSPRRTVSPRRAARRSRYTVPDRARAPIRAARCP